MSRSSAGVALVVATKDLTSAKKMSKNLLARFLVSRVLAALILFSGLIQSLHAAENTLDAAGSLNIENGNDVLTSGQPPIGQFRQLANGRTIHYHDQGKGPVVVFLHGSGAGASGYSNFKGNYPFLVEQGFRVIVPDLIGYGYSDKPDNVDYPLRFFADNVSLLLAELNIDKVAIIGNSLGGAVALDLALENPELVSKLVLMAPGGLEEQSAYRAMPGMKIFFDTFAGAPNKASLKRFLTEALVYDSSHVDDALIEERWFIFQQQNRQVVKTMQVPNLTARLNELTIPVLAMWGLNEKVMPLSGIETLAREVDDVKIVTLSRCGHWVMVEHRDFFNRTTVAFLK